ncbi:MAG: hypothetical protein IIC00_12485 [Planctomycetes bacterium]|nr:hypothetical protein [Planctomycetota bacterium]
MKSNIFIMMLVITLLFACDLSIFAESTDSSRDNFDLTRLRKFYDDKDMDSGTKMRQLVTYLKKEVSHPSQPRMGVGGGPIDTVYIQNVIIMVMAQTVPQETLLKALNKETDKKIKDMIMLALVSAGDQTFFNDVRPFLQSAYHNLFRLGAVRALRDVSKKELKPQLIALQYDTYSRVVFRDGAYRKVYPIRKAAYEALSRIGAKPKGWLLELPLAVNTEIEAVASILDDENPEQCVTILQMLGDYPGPQARTIVNRFLKDSVGKPHLVPAVKEAEKTLRKIENKEHPRIKISNTQLKAADPQHVLSLLAPYERDESRAVRRLAHLYGVRLAGLQPRPEVRQEVTARLVKVLVTPNSDLSPAPYKWLLSFTEKDFSNNTKAVIRQTLDKDNPNHGLIGIRGVVRICGVANIREELPHLKGLLIDELAYQAKADKTHNKKWYLTVGWAARLARARMGIKEDIVRCIELAEAEQDSTERVLRILPQIGYIRQPEAIKYLQKYLESKKRLPSVKATVLGELYASRVMHILAESLISYPVKKKEARNYTQEEINLCRKWMSEQTKWVIII